MTMKILFFSPHAFIEVHALPEAVVVEALKERGHDVVTVTCDGALSGFCISMSAAGLSPHSSTLEKDAVCVGCRKRRDFILKEFAFPSITLDEFIEKEDEQSIQDVLLTVRPENYIEFNWMNFPIGRYALFEFLLNNKLNSFKLNNVEWEGYKIHLYNALKVAYAGRRLLEKIKPDAVATYNSLYSVNHVFCILAEQRGIPHYTLHAGAHIRRRYSTMTIFKGLIASRLITRSKAWKTLSGIPISSSQALLVAEHLGELLNARDPWVYSIASKKASSESLRNYFGIDKAKQVLLVTMSSADEHLALTTIDAMPPFVEPMFPTPIDWINALIEFVRLRDDLFLIIRVHPREFPNKREQVLSKRAVELQKIFVNLPDNVRVNWPKDQISLHDLIKITDVGLNATSTSGVELGMFGAPVVLYDSNQLFSYPPEINYVAVDKDDYFKKIDMALEDGWSFENVRKTFRWLSYQLGRVAIDISDGFELHAVPAPLSFFQKNHNRLLRKFGLNSPYEAQLESRQILAPVTNRSVPLKNSELLCAAIENNLDSHLELLNKMQESSTTLEEETNAIREQVKNLFRDVSLNDDTPDEFTRKIKHVLAV